MSERIRWEPAVEGDSLIGYVDLLGPDVFLIWHANAGPGEWRLTSDLPGQNEYHLYRDGIDILKAEAERWLEEFVTSLGAAFPGERDEFEFPRDAIDLEVAFDLGAYVRYQHPDAGWEVNQEAGRKLLTHGRLYRVAWNDIGQSKTRIGLVGVKGSFNSVLFEPVPVEDVTDAEAAEVAARTIPSAPGTEG